MVNDLTDPVQAMRRQQDNVRRNNSRTRAQSTSVDRGAFRIKSEEGIEVGTEQDPTGTGTVWGTWNIQGLLQLIGRMVAEGDIDLLGNMNAEGTINLIGELIAEGLIRVSQGEIIVDGAVPIRLRQVSGSARVEFGDVARLFAQNGVALLSAEGAQVGVGPNAALLGASGKELGIDEDGIRFTGIPTGSVAKQIGLDSAGFLVQSGGGTDPGGDDGGSGGTGSYRHPVNGTITISDDWQEHVNRNSAEPGTDYVVVPGTSFYAPIDGQIKLVKSDTSGARGRVVEMRGSDGSWFAFLHLSSIAVTNGQSVTRGQRLGATGASGFGGESAYGAHLHLTFWQGPTTVRPAFNATNDFQLEF